ncbi:amino acid adenylation domain-containing protein [Lysobacter sp. BMK333-48F3]|uniref:non-ribosomal peptide synthetase/type I polyketide synthase n=1 Tax=Lysobacter sp. BMK333-48F3 TaxID=2867962 RepID=UPI001C8BDBF7|nr:non-ribosomal peptide synthetase/type I polyketide synthase [Lysobacter sp. BMK333-48F3]MBX9399676.1 amino acid adenylation domain-containing protein [Lysobacter sp. BMK333-48F3]
MSEQQGNRKPSPASDAHEAAIAIVGMAGRFPGAADLEAFWANLIGGIESVRDFDEASLREAGVPTSDLDDPRYVRRGAALDGIEAFDAGFFAMTALEARSTDPQQRLFLQTAWAALEHAGYAPGCAAPAGTVGVYASASSNAYFLERLSRQPELMEAVGPMALAIGNEKDYLATRTAYKLGLQGPAVTVQTACSSSLVAVHLACQALLAGECDMALAGGVSVRSLEPRGYRHVDGGILSADGRCRPFDADASGTVSGDGVAAVVLKPLAQALADGDCVHAVIIGSAVNNDGHDKTGFTAPSVEGQAAVVREALAVAGVEAETIGYVEAHGTGTALGDPIEFAALRSAFGDADAAYCALGALKANIGHLDAAAGIAGLVKAALAVSRGELPPNPHLRRLNPHIDAAGSPFRFPLAREPWPLRQGVRRAGVSSFGIGGTNAHVVLESPPAPAPAVAPQWAQPLLLSARTPTALASLSQAMRRRLADAGAAYAAIAHTTRAGRKAFRYRSALAAVDALGASAQLDGAAVHDAENAPALAFLFPGQGSQAPAMAAALYAAYPGFREDVDACARTLEPQLGFDLRPLLLEPAQAARLDATELAQPALFVAGYALARLLESFGLRPRAMLGHSLGEYVAACLAGVIARDDALRLVALRGRLVAQLPAGAMLAAMADEAGLRERLLPQVEIAAVNGARQCTLAGPPEAVAAQAAALEAAGIACRRLPVSHAFHSAMLEPILQRFAEGVANTPLSAPQRPYISNLDGGWIGAEQATSVDYWVAHMRQAVRFDAGLRTLATLGELVTVEVGPGAALGAFAQAAGVALQSFRTLAAPGDGDPLAPLRATLAALWARGHRIDWRRAVPEAPRQRAPAPGHPFAEERHWIEVAPQAAAASPRAADALAPIETAAAKARVPGWRRLPRPPREWPAAPRQELLWFADPGGADTATLAEVRARGWPVRVVSAVAGIAQPTARADGFALDPAQPQALAELIAELAQAGDVPSRIVYAWPMSARDGDGEDAQRLCLDLPIALLRALETGPARHVAIDVLTVAAQSVDGREHDDPVQALVAGVCRVAPLEHSRIACRWLDAEGGAQDPRAPADPALLASALTGADSGPAVVALRGAYAWVPELDDVDQAGAMDQASLRDGGHYLILGGNGGIGLAFAEYLAARVANPRLTLVARSAREQPREDIAERLAGLRECGASVRLIGADIADADALRAAVAEAVAAHGAVELALHAAGAAGEGLIRQTDRMRLAPVLSPKTAGLRALDEALGAAPARIVLCSSINALRPAPGQVGYCAAAAYLDAYAQKRSRPGRRIVSINWGPWPGIGMAAQQTQARPDARAIADAFDAALGFGGRQMLLTPGAARTVAEPCVVDAVPAQSAGSEFEVVVARMRVVWQALFGREVGDDADFFALGGHSLMALQLIARVQRDFGVEPALQALLAAPTLAGMARAVLSAMQGSGADALPAADRRRPLPLSWSQQRLWFLDRLDAAAGAAYHIAAGVRLRGALDESALARALQRIAERHESLRTVFEHGVDGPVQVVRDEAGWTLQREDLEALPAEEREAALQQACSGWAAAPFDLAAQPPVRARLLRLQADEHVLVLVQHHIVSDGWSQGVLVRELGALYAAYAQGRPDPLPPLPLQYADYAAWQRARLSQADQADQVEAWCAQLRGAPELLALPSDRPRPPVQSYRGGRLAVRLDAPLTRRLRELAQAQGTTLYTVLLAGWSALLSRLSGQDDVVIGSPAANRPRVELEGLIGFFVNTLALRMRVEEGATTAALLAQARARVLEGQGRQEVPFERVVEALHPQRSLSHSPVFQTLLSLDNTPQRSLALPGLEVEGYAVAHGATQFDLSLTLREEGAELSGAIEYASDLFDASTVARWSHWLERLLGAMADSPEAAVASLPLLDEQERRQLLQASAGASAEASDRTLVELFEAQVARTPEAVALRSGEAQLSYAQLEAASNRVAHALIGLGVVPDACVGLCADRGVELIVGLLGILKAGGAYVPLDPGYPRERVLQMLDDAAPVAVVSAGGAAARLGIDGYRVLEVEATADSPQTHAPDVALRPEHLAYVIYTSGSTGRPKGVMVEHRQVAALFAATQAAFDFGPGDVWSVFHSFAFDFSVWEVWGALLYGGCAVVVPWECTRSPEDFLALLARERVSMLSQTPSAFRQLIAAGAAAAPLPALRAVVFGGEALDPRMLRSWIEGHPPERVALVNMYGITEITVHASYLRLQREAIERGHGSPIGEALPHLSLYVLDAAGEPAPVGVPGELHVGGAGVARGYLHRPELTAQRFFANPFVAGDRLYRTGDLARRRADGGLDYLGRNDFQVKIRGHRIELGEVEAALRGIDEVRGAVVEAREDATGERRLVAYYEAAQAGTTPQSLRAALAAALPSYLVPAAFVRVERWPLTPSGKLDRAALPAPDADAAVHRPYRAPADALRQVLAEVWAEALRVPVEGIGVDDNFFELGGDSIRSIAVVAEGRRRGLNFAVADLFRHPTVDALAQAIAAAPASAGAAGSDEPDGRWLSAESAEDLPEGVEDAWDATLLQQGMIFHGEYGGARGVYHDVFSYRIDLPRWDEAAMRTALDTIASRHPVLRSGFELRGDGTVRQCVHSAARIGLRCRDLRSLDAQQQRAAVLEFLAERRAQPWPLGQAPLLAFFVDWCAANRIQLTIAFHHAILDGWSVALMQTELFGEYFRALGIDVPAPPAPMVPAKAGVWLERQALGDVRHAEFWSGYLADAEPTVLADLPGEWPQGDVRNPTVEVPAPVAARLAALAAGLGVPLRSVLLAAHLQVIGVFAGTQRPMTGVVCNTRPETAGGERSLGLFLNTLPLRATAAPGSWKQRILAVFDEENRLAEHRRYPYFRIVSEHGHRARLDAVFNYVHFHAHQGIHDAVRGGLARMEAGEVDTIESTGFGLTTTFSGAGDRLALAFDADRSRFGRAQLMRMADAYLRVLEAIAADAEAPWQDTTVLSAAERARLTLDWNATARDYPQEVMHAGFERQVRLQPQAPAVLCGEERWSYQTLNRHANRIAHGLLAEGVRAGDRVGILLERGPWMLAAVLAVVKAGAAYVPLDPAHPPQRLRETLQDCTPARVLSQRSLARHEGVSAVPVLCVDEAERWDGQAQTNPSASGIGTDPQALAYVIYTSGSTGRPKGVMVRHAAAANLFAWVEASFGMGPSDRVLFTTSLSFDLSVYDLFGMLWSGGSVQVARSEEVRDPARLVELLRSGITFWDSAPAVFAGLLGSLQGEVSSDLRLAFFSGDWIGLDLPDALRRAFPRCEVVALGGATEATVWSNYHRVGQVDPGWKSIPYGRPIWNARYYVLDGRGEPSPVGVPGDLYIAGACLAAGYWNRPELTAERFVADPFVAGERMYRTGDRARYWADGTLEFLGRSDFQVKVRGYRIELGEIESALQACAGVREAVVAAHGDAGGERRLVAYWLGEAVEAASLRSQLQSRLPEYMLPSAYVHMERWPLTPNGKLDRAALPAPEGEAHARQAYEAPQGEVEQALAQLWTQLLGVERIGRHDHFFALGGHSLLLVQLSSRMRETFAVELSIDLLIRNPALGAMAAAVVEAQFQTYLGSDAQALAEQLDGLSREELLALLDEEDGVT